MLIHILFTVQLYQISPSRSDFRQHISLSTEPKVAKVVLRIAINGLPDHHVREFKATHPLLSVLEAYQTISPYFERDLGLLKGRPQILLALAVEQARLQVYGGIPLLWLYMYMSTKFWHNWCSLSEIPCHPVNT